MINRYRSRRDDGTYIFVYILTLSAEKINEDLFCYALTYSSFDFVEGTYARQKK